MCFRDAPFYRYHSQTKHTLEKLYAGNWQLDWANQPDPVRRYEGAPVTPLPVPLRPAACSYFDLSDRQTDAQPTIESLSQLLYYSMALATWKQLRDRRLGFIGNRWALRVNPSSGNLHPTETHLVARGVQGLADGCYHFRVDNFTLENRWQGPVEDLAGLFDEQCGLPAAPLTIVLTSIFWREAWKYRDRAFRYCHHDLGHALAAVTEAARGLGLTVCYRHLFDDRRLSGALGFTGGDEIPGLLIAIGPQSEPPAHPDGPTRAYAGRPNRLSDEVIAYESIEMVYAATARPDLDLSALPRPLELKAIDTIDLPQYGPPEHDFWHVVRTRRSGVDFDARTGTDLAALSGILKRVARGAHGDLFNAPDRAGRAFVHLFLYLHRIPEVEPGLYYYDRPGHRLLALQHGDLRRTAAELSLGQSIAGNSAFAVSMIADLAGARAAYGDRAYRAVHIEAGFIGQGLYLGPEAVGLNATGIGAFFDDDVNRFLEFPDGFEVIYHFTVGRSVPDPRLTDEPAYPFKPTPKPS